MAKKRSKITIDDPLIVFPYSPTIKPFPVPTITDICEGSLFEVTLPCALVPYIVGALEVWRWEDAFIGTLDERKAAAGLMRDLIGVILMSSKNCGCETLPAPLRRLNPDTGAPEISPDGGETWIPDPESVYVMATEAKPLGGADGDVKRCEAANNVVDHMKDLQAEWSTMVGQLTDFQDLVIQLLVAAVALLLAPIGIALLVTAVTTLIPKVAQLVRFLLGVTPEQYDALFTEENWTLARCIIYCNTPANAKYTEADRQAIMSQLRAQITNPSVWAGDSLACMVDVWDVVGLRNAARIGAGTEGNCDDCGCSECIDFNILFGTLNPQTEGNTLWIDGVWDGANNRYYAILDNRPSQGGDGKCCFVSGLSFNGATVNEYTVKCDGGEGFFTCEGLTVVGMQFYSLTPFTATIVFG